MTHAKPCCTNISEDYGRCISAGGGNRWQAGTHPQKLACSCSAWLYPNVHPHAGARRRCLACIMRVQPPLLSLQQHSRSIALQGRGSDESCISSLHVDPRKVGRGG